MQHVFADIGRAYPDSDLQHVFADIGRAYPDSDGGRTVHLQLLAQSVVGQSRGPLWTLLGAVLAVLQVALSIQFILNGLSSLHVISG